MRDVRFSPYRNLHMVFILIVSSKHRAFFQDLMIPAQSFFSLVFVCCMKVM